MLLACVCGRCQKRHIYIPTYIQVRKWPECKADHECIEALYIYMGQTKKAYICNVLKAVEPGNQKLLQWSLVWHEVFKRLKITYDNYEIDGIVMSVITVHVMYCTI